MNCHGFQTRYEAYMGDELTDALAAKVEEHLAECPACREWYQTQQAIGEALRAAADSSLPPAQYFEGLYQRVAPRLERASVSERFAERVLTPIQAFFVSGAPPLRFARAALVCSASLALGAILAPTFLSPPERSSALSLAALESDKDNPAVAVAVAPPRLPKEAVTAPKEAVALLDIANTGGGASSVAPAFVQTVSMSPEPKTGPAPEWLAGPDAVDGSIAPITLPEPRADSGGVNIARKLKEYSVFEELQALKTGLYRTGQQGFAREVERVEKALCDLSEFQDAEEADYQKQMQIYQEAEKASLAEDAATAEKKYREAIAVNAKTRWACIARYDLGSLYYETARDFDKAQESYSACKNDYRAEFLNESQRATLDERLAALDLYKPLGYKPLALFQAAAASAPEEAADPYLQLIREYPQTPLAREAALELARLCAEEKSANAVAWPEIYAEFTQSLRRDPSGPLAAHFLFATAEIQNFRFQERREAMLEYMKARQMTDDPDLRKRAADRLNDLRYSTGAGREE